MAQKVRDVMSAPPLVVGPKTSVVQVADVMRDEDIGTVLIAENDRLIGLVTDRDLVVRILTRGGNVEEHAITEACSEELISVSPDDDIDRAIGLMRQHAVRRLPVTEGNRPVGIVALGDLAVERDPDSALADISAAEPNQ
ncbi:CBS domain-containing protein [Streptomyces pristinaespiralis]|uniref:CBS domain-containing protein n=1 Tax=Streptomyces pristinaespiralis TaxID=38300 RepID=UPI0033CEA7B2